MRESSPAMLSKYLVIFGAGLSAALLLGMTALDRNLKTPAAPAGIISLELAGNLARVERILASWDQPARIQAGISLGLDFFFLAAYAFTLAGACRLLASHLPHDRRRLKALGRILARGQWCAALLDAVENLALIQLLIGSGQAWQANLAALCAWPKFTLAGGALLYIFALGGAVLLKRAVLNR